jgi:hypothetical protein
MATYYKNPTGQYVMMPDDKYVLIADDNPEYLAIIAEHEVLDYVPPVPVVTEVSPYQARVALHLAGLLPTVEALMADPATPVEAKLAWEYATTIQRNSAFINTLGPALGLTTEQIDGLFVAASQVV